MAFSWNPGALSSTGEVAARSPQRVSPVELNALTEEPVVDRRAALSRPVRSDAGFSVSALTEGGSPMSSLPIADAGRAPSVSALNGGPERNQEPPEGSPGAVSPLPGSKTTVAGPPLSASAHPHAVGWKP